MAGSVAAEFHEPSNGLLAALSFAELAGETTRLSTLHRYEAHSQRIWRLALKQLHDEQARRERGKLPNNPEQIVDSACGPAVERS